MVNSSTSHVVVALLQAEKPFSCKHLSVLGRLSNLQELFVMMPDNSAVLDVPESAPQQPNPAKPYTWVGSLSELTRLAMSIPTVSGLSSISNCTSLCSLVLQGAVGQGPKLQLGEAEWDALGHLTKLTSLEVSLGFQAAVVSEACTAAVLRMGSLEILAGPLWSEDTLQVFSQLPCLSLINGCWGAGQLGDIAPPRILDHVCGHVTCLEVLGGSVPFRAFPNLLVLCFYGGPTLLTLEDLTDLPNRCPKLKEVWVNHERQPSLTLGDTTPLPERLAAIKSLSRLEHLSVLGWKPSVDAEVAALVAALESLAELDHVAVVMERGSRVSCVGLLHLARLVQLDKLQIIWKDETRLPDVAGAAGLLSVICRIRCVEVLVRGDDGEGCMQDARRLCGEQALPLPQELVIKML
jgi:hypothetical protein